MTTASNAFQVSSAWTDAPSRAPPPAPDIHPSTDSDERRETMRRGMRAKLLGLMTGAILLVGAGSAFAAPGVATGVANDHRDGKDAHGKHHVLVFGKITDTDDDSFTLATRWGKVKVKVDDDTKFKHGDEDDLKKGKLVAVAGKKTDHGKIKADVVVFLKKHEDRKH